MANEPGVIGNSLYCKKDRLKSSLLDVTHLNNEVRYPKIL